MTIKSLRNEMRWTVAFVIFMFFGMVLCDKAIHEDFEKFRASKDSFVDKGWMNAYMIGQMADTMQKAYRAEIMPSCIKGQKTN